MGNRPVVHNFVIHLTVQYAIRKSNFDSYLLDLSFSFKPHWSRKGAVVPLGFSNHLELVVVEGCCHVTLFGCVSGVKDEKEQS